MKLLMAVIGLLASGLISAKTLDTPHFKVIITCQNPENRVGCDKASYSGTEKATGEKIDLMGKQLMEKCAEGVSPCHSLGYEFSNGKITYFVTEAGQLQVTDGAKVLVDETGTWVDWKFSNFN